MNSSDNYNHCFKKKENVANEKKKKNLPFLTVLEGLAFEFT